MPYPSCQYRGYFRIRLGIVMERSPVPLHEWLVGALLMIRCKGAPSLQPARDLGITRESASSWPRAPLRHETAIFGGPSLRAVSGSRTRCS